jgi:hypothetical protein
MSFLYAVDRAIHRAIAKQPGTARVPILRYIAQAPEIQASEIQAPEILAVMRKSQR